MDVPANHYQPSGRPFPSALSEVSYPEADRTRMVHKRGHIRFAGNQFPVGEAFAGHPVALRLKKPDGSNSPDGLDGPETAHGEHSGQASTLEWEVYFCRKNVRVIESEIPDR